ncbi:cytochrome o ubiquinol oxidase subunit IV [Sphingomonas sp. NFX23]|uniref:cytochrome o ubiquinol oxidase subunit IV n=1 Tax=Sphingomonas sp. NFX23 TaxID=2819532 RepID=UPI003CE96F55
MDLKQRNAVHDQAPGDEHGQVLAGVLGYVIGLCLTGALTAASFWVAESHVLWGPGTAIALCVLAIAQIGVHLVFFLHITTGPDNTNNVLALVFGILIVFLIIAGSIFIMSNLNMMMPMGGASDPASTMSMQD